MFYFFFDSRWRFHDTWFWESQVVLHWKGLHFTQSFGLNSMAKMRYAEMPRDVSCDSLSTLRITNKSYQNGDTNSNLSLDLKIQEESDEESSRKTKSCRTKTNSPRSPEKMGFNLMKETKETTGRSYLKSISSITRSPSAALEYSKKCSAPTVLTGGNRNNFDHVGWVKNIRNWGKILVNCKWIRL